jgi:hypothetical protein
MFFDYVGSYFSQRPTNTPLALGELCPICGAKDVQLWRSKMGAAQCLAQITISRKRSARTSALAPCEPINDRQGMTSFGDGSMVLAGPNVARVWTKLLPDRPLPSGIEVVFPVQGSITNAIAGLVRSPPPPPFVAILFGQRSNFQTALSIDNSLVRLSGPDPVDIPRETMLGWANLVGGIPLSAVRKILALRDQLALGATVPADAKSLQTLRDRHPEIIAGLSQLPSSGSSYASILYKLLA